MNVIVTVPPELPPEHSNQWGELMMNNLADPTYAEFFHLGREKYSPDLSPVVMYFSLPKRPNCLIRIALPAFQHGWEYEAKLNSPQETQDEQRSATEQESPSANERENQARHAVAEATAPDAEQSPAGSVRAGRARREASPRRREKAAAPSPVRPNERIFNVRVGNHSEMMTGSIEDARARVEEMFRVRHLVRGGWEAPEWKEKNRLFARNSRHDATVEVGGIRELK